MKKLIALSTVMIMLATGAKAQIQKAGVVKEETEVPAIPGGLKVSYKTKQQFAKDFFNANVKKWEKSGVYDKATFLKNGEVGNAYYGSDSKLVGTITDKQFTDLPKNAQNDISADYGDYDIEAVGLYDDNELNPSNIVLYSQSFDNWDNYFVKLKKGSKEIMLKINLGGDVLFFKQLK